ncbi:MAG TPA: alpha/beta fold hydrolase [Gallionellaceae bacterium]|nr:alpha/beta fold hydrolase [Gallionellaceae bacterium]
MGLHKFSIPAPSGVLHGMVHMPEVEPRAIAVVAHPLPVMGGTMDNKIVTTLAKTFAELGFVALRFNFRGVGESSGTYDEGNGETEDALAIAHYAQQEFGAHLPLILAGFSFGGYVQARAAEQLHARKLVLIAPAVGRFAMPHVPAGSLIVHGEQDEVVTLADMLTWARPQHLPIVVVPEAEHYFHGRLHQLKEIVSQHFLGQSI